MPCLGSAICHRSVTASARRTLPSGAARWSRRKIRGSRNSCARRYRSWLSGLRDLRKSSASRRFRSFSSTGSRRRSPIPEEAFWYLDGPIDRVAVADVPMPYHPVLLDAVLPSVDQIAQRLEQTL